MTRSLCISAAWTSCGAPAYGQRPQRALLVTTSAFSEVVRKSAAVPGQIGSLVAPVQLIDGEELVEPTDPPPPRRQGTRPQQGTPIANR